MQLSTRGNNSFKEKHKIEPLDESFKSLLHDELIKGSLI